LPVRIIRPLLPLVPEHSRESSPVIPLSSGMRRVFRVHESSSLLKLLVRFFNRIDHG
jgi:hypothetical protein